MEQYSAHRPSHLHRIYSNKTHDKHQQLLLQFIVLLKMDAKSVRNMQSIIVVVNKHNTARVASCWFIIYYIILYYGDLVLKSLSSARFSFLSCPHISPVIICQQSTTASSPLFLPTVYFGCSHSKRFVSFPSLKILPHQNLQSFINTSDPSQ